MSAAELDRTTNAGVRTIGCGWFWDARKWAGGRVRISALGLVLSVEPISAAEPGSTSVTDGQPPPSQQDSIFWRQSWHHQAERIHRPPAPAVLADRPWTMYGFG